MAINKKLKKFNDDGSYRNFLTTSDFQKPDASSIGAAAIPTNITQNPNHWYNASTNEGSRDDFYNNVPTMDLEYNPKCMLLVNCKYYVHPTATTINPIIDTVTDGTIGCWWRYTTGTTWTKLNSSDLQFYKGYTQSKITNLSFNTIGVSNLRNDSNVEYMFSAQTPTVGTNCEEIVSYKFTDNCIQRGTITIDGATFDATGGTKSVQVRTGAGNPWRITNTNGWLTFSTLTGVGPTTISVTAAAHTSETERTGTVTIEYTDMVYSTTGTFVQDAVEQHFDWDEAETSATPNMITINIGWDVTSITETYTNNYPGLAVYGSTSWVTSKGLTSTSSNGSFTATTQQNTSSDPRNYTFMIQSNGVNVGSIQIIQAPKPSSYFYVGNTASEAATSALTACTYASTVSSAASSYTVYYNSNYTSGEIGSLTFQTDAMFQSASFAAQLPIGPLYVSVKENSMGSAARSGDIWIKSGSTNIAKITFNQAAGATPPANYFYWGNSGSATTSGGNATYNSTSVSCSYRTNYSSLTTATTDTWITSATLNNGTFTVTFPQNSTYVERTATIQIKNGSTVVGTFNLTQEPAPTPNYFYWGTAGSATTTAVTVTSAATTTGNVPYRTNYSSLTTATTDTWITAATISSGNFSASFAANPNTTDRTGTVNIKSGSNVVGTISITQQAKAYFLWSNGATAITKSIAAATTSDSTTYTTNMTGLTLTSAASYTWITAKGITNTAGNGTFSATTQQNSTTTARTGEFLVKTGSTTVGTLSLQQAATGITYTLTAYTGTSGTATATTVDSGRTVFQLRVYANQNWTGSSNQTWLTLNPTTGSNDSAVIVTAATNDEGERSATITFTGAHGQTCYITVTQQAKYEPVTYDFRWDDNGQTAITVSNISGDGGTGRTGYEATGYTSIRVGTTPYSWLTLSTNGSVSSYLYYTAATNDSTDSRSDGNTIQGLRQDGVWENCGYITHEQNGGSTPPPPTYSITTYGSVSNAPMTGTTNTSCSVTAENQGWTLYSKPDWVSSVSPTTGSAGNTSLTITVSANETTSSRSGSIRINGNVSDYDTISVSQVAGSGSPVTYSITAYTGSSGTATATTAGSASTSFTARVITENQGWSVDTSSSDDWLSASPSSTGSSGTKSVTISVEANPYTYSRTGYIYFDGASSGYARIKVEQAAKETPVSYSISAYSGITGSYTAATVNSGSTSFRARVVTQNQGWSVDTTYTDSWLSADPSSTGSSGTKYIDINVDANDSTSDRTGYIYFDGGVQGSASIKVTQRAKDVPPATLTGITITITNVPTVACTGGTVNKNNISYTVTANYSDGTSTDVTNSATVSGSKTVYSLGSTRTTGTTDAGTVTLSASYGGKSDNDSATVYQAANDINTSTQRQTGTRDTTHTTVDDGTSYGSYSYTISCDPTSETVDAAAGSVTVDVTSQKSRPYTSTTHEEWYIITGYTAKLCTNSDYTWEETGTTKQTGNTHTTTGVTEPTNSTYSTARTQTWASYNTSTHKVSYNAYTTTGTRSVTFTFTNVEAPYGSRPTCTFVLTQNNTPTGRYVTFTFSNNYFENSSHMGGGSLTIFNMRFQCLYNSDVVFEATYDDGGDGLAPAEGTNYPDGRWWTVNQGLTQNKFQIWVDYGVTHADFLLSFDQISGHSGEGGMSVSRGVVAYFTDSDTDVTVTFEDIEWRNE